jgi:hypothetical protein
MKIKSTGVANSRPKRVHRRRSKPNLNARVQSSWLTMLFEDGEISEDEEESGDEELSAPLSQPLPIKRGIKTR